MPEARPVLVGRRRGRFVPMVCALLAMLAAAVAALTVAAPAEAAVSFAPSYRVAIGDAQWARIKATGTWRAGCPVGRYGLTNVSVPFFGFDGAYHRGLITVNRDVARSTARAFDYMAAHRFPLSSVIPVERFGGSDVRSELANNSSGFNCRRPAELASPSLRADAHANGRAVDINPVYNPWIRPGTRVWEPSNGTWYGNHRSGAIAGEVVKGGVAWTAFRVVAGWPRWQTATSIDYMHFDTGYPSVYRPGL